MRLLTTILLFAWIFGCRSTANRSLIKTDLIDNETVAQNLQNYMEFNHHCRPTTARKRALVTGFGLFGKPHNISGIVAMSLVKPAFFPSRIDLADGLPESVSEPWRHGEDRSDNGGFVRQRTLVIDGEEYEICALYLDVQWDLAAAIILYEAGLFRPDLIIMSGMNGGEPTLTLFESGAVNKATQYAGFGPTGSQTFDNVPIEENIPVLPDMPVGQKVALSWDAARLAIANRDLIESLSVDNGYTVDVGEIRDDNDYICNNVSLVVGEAMRGRTVRLAGSQIVIPGLNYGAKVGFLHYPSLASEPSYANSQKEIYGWTKVLAQSIKLGI